MDSTTLTSIISTVAAALSGLITWMVGKKKRQVELEKKETEIQQMKNESSLQIMQQYQEALDDLKDRYESRFDYLKKEYAIRHEDLKADYERKYQRLLEEKHGEIAGLKREIESLRRNLELWKKKYRDLKTDFEK